MIHRDVQGSVTVLRMEHGKVQALDLEFLEELALVFREVARDDARAIVLTGAGGSFSAGVDLFRVLEGGRAYIERFLPALDAGIEALFTLPKPVVAAINGHALAGGCILACACDRRVMASGKGRVGVPELLVGVPYPSLALEVVRCATPPQHLHELVNGGAGHPPADALARGLIDEVVEPQALATRALEVAEQLARIPARSFELVKRQLRAPAVERWRELRGEHDAAVREAWCSSEVQASIRGYLERTLGRSSR